MFDLEKTIAEWRQQMERAGMNRCSALDELESHLRDEIQRLSSEGVPEARVFAIAAANLGSAKSLKLEFRKIGNARSRSLALSPLLWVAALFSIALLLQGRVFGEHSDLLLASHIFFLTAGYVTVLFTGGLGIYYVCCRYLRKSLANELPVLHRKATAFNWLSLGFITTGLLLGILWSKHTLGCYFAGDPREIGATGIFVWLVGSCVAQRLTWLNEQAVMLVSVVGNLIMILAWFGAGVMAESSKMYGYHSGRYWFLAALLGFHFIILLLGIIAKTLTHERRKQNV